jgi:7-cyano-7-deazaguanine synthase
MSQVVVVSGGLDSVTLLHHAVHTRNTINEELHVISFNYGQKHKGELLYARYHASLLGASIEVVDLTNITYLLAQGGSSLVSDSEVPEGHYGEESMKQTVVPNRNMIMASIAAGYAVAIGAKGLWMGVHAGDHFIYPDCRPPFFQALNASIVIGNEGFGSISEQPEMQPLQDFVFTPFIKWSKNQIAHRAFELNVEIENTWSCYKGGSIHCGKCGTCVERQEAIHSTGYLDPTTYEDNQFWKEALKRETV